MLISFAETPSDRRWYAATATGTHLFRLCVRDLDFRSLLPGCYLRILRDTSLPEFFTRASQTVRSLHFHILGLMSFTFLLACTPTPFGGLLVTSMQFPAACAALMHILAVRTVSLSKKSAVRLRVLWSLHLMFPCTVHGYAL